VTPELREALRVVAEANPPGSAIPVPRETLLELALPRARVQAPAVADLTVKEAGLILQRKPVTVRLWCERGQVPGAYKYGAREWRIPLASVEALRASLQGGARLKFERRHQRRWTSALTGTSKCNGRRADAVRRFVYVDEEEVAEVFRRGFSDPLELCECGVPDIIPGAVTLAVDLDWPETRLDSYLIPDTYPGNRHWQVPAALVNAEATPALLVERHENVEAIARVLCALPRPNGEALPADDFYSLARHLDSHGVTAPGIAQEIR